MEAQEPFARDALIERLLCGGIEDRSELAAIAELCAFDVQADSYVCILIYISPSGPSLTARSVRSSTNTKAIVRLRLEAIYGRAAHCHDADIDLIATVIGLGPGLSKWQLNEQFAHARRRLRHDAGVNIRCVGGEIVHDVLDASRSYASARQVVLGPVYGEEEPIHWYDADHIAFSRYYYPLELETLLLGALIAGNAQKANDILDVVVRSNFRERRLSSVIAETVLAELRGTLMKAVGRCGLLATHQTDVNGIEADLRALKLDASVDEFFGKSREIVDRLCSMVDRAKRSHNARLLETILATIDENYCQPMLGLSYVAESVGISQVYLSQFFKEQMGENFTAYITRLRVSHARRILEDRPSVSVSDVAHRVGYLHSDTFRKAFRRVYGVSPNSVRTQA